MNRSARLLAHLTIAGALSWPTVLVAYGLNLAVTFVGGYGATATTAQRIVAVTVGTAAMFAVVAVGALVESRARSGVGRGILALAFFAIAGALRGTVVSAFFIVWGVQSDSAEWPRVIGGVALGLAVLTPMSLLVGQARDFAAARSRLLFQCEQLEASMRQVSDQIEERDESVIERIRVSLVDALAARPGGSAEPPQSGSPALGEVERDSAARLEALARDVIRPLSHELANAVPSVQMPDVSTPTGRIRWPEIMSRAVSGAPFLPWSTALLIALLSGPPLVVIFGPWLAIGLTAVGIAIVVLLFTAANMVLRTCCRTSSLGWRWVVVLASALVVAIVSGVAGHGIFVALAAVEDLAGVASPFRAFVLLVPGLAIPLTIARGSARAREDVLGDLRGSDEMLARQLTRLRQVQWSQQRMFARGLHGPVQTLVVSGAARLREAAEPERALRASELQRSLLDLLDTQTSVDDRVAWSDGMARIAATWGGLVELGVEVDREALERLAADRIGCDVALEVVGESVANAVRHGRASVVDVSLTMVGDDLCLRIADDGSEGLASGSGMGSRVLEECCLSWERGVTPSGVVLDAVLPLAADSFMTTVT